MAARICAGSVDQRLTIRDKSSCIVAGFPVEFAVELFSVIGKCFVRLGLSFPPNGFLIRRSQVRVLPGAFLSPYKITTCKNLHVYLFFQNAC